MMDYNMVYGWLEDEKSKYIFEQRRLYNETGNFSHIENIIKNCVPQARGNIFYDGKDKELIKDIGNKKIIIWGAGGCGRGVAELLEKNGMTAELFIDKDIKKQGKDMQGVRIAAPEELLAISDKQEYVVLISPANHVLEIEREVKELGYNSIICSDYLFAGYEEQYFDEEIIHMADEEVFVDCGCYDGYTTKTFIKNMERQRKKYKTVYAFELNPANYKICDEFFKKEHMQRIKLINAGVWNEDTEMAFTSELAGSHITGGDGKGNRVNVVALDSVIKERITLLKMDIEGAELRALHGAQNLIKKYKPALAICVYHKSEDLTEIPAYIKELVPEYRLYIRHYSNYVWETVLYAVI